MRLGKAKPKALEPGGWLGIDVDKEEVGREERKPHAFLRALRVSIPGFAPLQRQQEQTMRTESPFLRYLNFALPITVVGQCDVIGVCRKPQSRSLHSESSPEVKVLNAFYPGEPVSQAGPFYS